MELIYHQEAQIEDLTIISDSKSVKESVESAIKDKQPAINTLLVTAHTLKVAGTRENLCWIPNHVGIPANEIAN